MPEGASLAFLFPGIGAGGRARVSGGLSPLGIEAAHAISAWMGEDVLTPDPALMARGARRDALAMAQLFVACLSDFGALCVDGLAPAALGAYSAGIFPALVAGGAVSVEEGARLLFATLEGAREAGVGGDLVGVLGLAPGQVAAALGGRGHLSHVNGPRHVLVGGADDAVEALAAEMLKAGAFSTRALRLTFPYHTPLMTRAVAAAYAWLAQGRAVSPRAAIIPLVTGAGALAGSGDALLGGALGAMASPIDWPGAAQTLHGMGIRRISSVGPGEGLLRWTARLMPEVRVERLGENGPS